MVETRQTRIAEQLKELLPGPKGIDIGALRLVEIIRDPGTQTQHALAAVKLAWEYRYGRAPVEMKLGAAAMSDEDLIGAAKAVLESMEADVSINGPLIEED